MANRTVFGIKIAIALTVCAWRYIFTRLSELSFWAKKSGQCKAKASLLMFTNASWKSKILCNKEQLTITTSTWEKYRCLLKIQEKTKAAIIHFAVEGKDGAVWMDDLILKKVSLNKTAC